MAAARSAPSSRSTRHWLRGLASDADICCGATPTRSNTTACRFRTPSDGCTATVPRSTLCSRQYRRQQEGLEDRTLQVGLPNVGKSTFFNIVTKVGSRTGDSRNIFRKEYKEKHPDVKQVSVIAGALLLHTSGTVSGAVVLLEATGVMVAVYGGDHKLSVNSIWLLRDGLGLIYGDVDILFDLKLLICGLVSYYGLIFFVLTLSLVRGKL
ncbi:hypothetical protein VPH35_116986 [Triticum aestivum]